MEDNKNTELFLSSIHEFNGYWNGENCTFNIVNVVIPEFKDGYPKMAWWKPYEGDVRQAVIVIYKGAKFLIDNETGYGYNKVVNGGGGPGHPHKSLPPLDDCIIKSYCILEENNPFDIGKYSAESKFEDEYWEKKDPDGFKRVQALKNRVQKIWDDVGDKGLKKMAENLMNKK